MGGVAHRNTGINWEAMWAPYDEAMYQSVLAQITAEDIVLDIGAGDLRLARRMVEKCQKVYAIEIQEALLNKSSLEADGQIIEDLIVIRGDARQVQFPSDITAGVLLMRHCTQFQLYAKKLREAGAERLITNARWRLGVEAVQLGIERKAFSELDLGWYACWCGEAGFKPGPVERLIPEILDVTHEVIGCPRCLEFV